MDVDVFPLLALQRGRKAQAALLQLPPLSPVWGQGLIYPAGTHAVGTGADLPCRDTHRRAQGSQHQWPKPAC